MSIDESKRDKAPPAALPKPSPFGKRAGKDKTGTQPGDPDRALYQASLATARRLKYEHRAYYRAAPKTFRDTVRKAHSRIFRIKPGPKPKRDPRIAQAARKRAGGVPWVELYPNFIDGYGEITEYTRGLAEEGFKGKVNDYLRNNPSRKSPKAITENNSDG
jgi:hypothetical protein